MNKYKFIKGNFSCGSCCFNLGYPRGCGSSDYLTPRFRNKCILGEGIWQIKLTLNANIKVL